LKVQFFGRSIGSSSLLALVEVLFLWLLLWWSHTSNSS